jgi:hypothetical protein
MAKMFEGWANSPEGEQTVTKAGRWEAAPCKGLKTQGLDTFRDPVNGCNYWVPSAIVTQDHRLSEETFSLLITRTREWHGGFKSHAEAHKFHAEWQENNSKKWGTQGSDNDAD